MKTKFFALLLTTLPILFMSSCKKDVGGMNNGQVYVRMMDAPSPYNFEKVNVDIQSVEINMTNAAGPSQWITLQTHAGIYNLLDLTNGLDTLLGQGQVAVGSLEQMRFILGDNNSVVVGGINYPMDVPSGNTSGLKLNVHQTITGVKPLNLFIDFDAGQSVVINGNGSYSLKPVLRAFVESETGSVKGRVTTAASGIAITLASDIKPVYTTYANSATGEFMLRGVASGTYTLKVYPADSDIPVVIDNVFVSAGSITDVGLIHMPR